MTDLWFDTHAHLSDAQFDSDRDAAIERAVQAGVAIITEIADGPEEWSRAKALAERHHERLWWAAGLHPYYADRSTSDVWRALAREARHPRFVAIGEIGLDYAKSTISKENQIHALISGLETARDLQKPVILHCRNAYEDLLPILKERFSTAPSGPAPGVVHCFSGTREDAEALLERGFFLGIDAPLTYPSARALRETVRHLPVDRLVLETDSPYLPPQTHRGKRNEPAYLPATGARLAELLGMPVNEIAARTTANGRRLFRLDNTA